MTAGRDTTRRAGLARLSAAGLASLALIAGCSDDQQEIRTWMQQQRASTPTVRERIAPPKRHEPFRYASAGLSDPFARSRLSPGAGAQADSGLRPDANRRREALEAFPLDTIRMVGHLANAHSSYALLQVDDMVYQARVGNYAGQNYGRIVRLNESEVRLKELVQDAAGDWVERETTLRLQERKPQEVRK